MGYTNADIIPAANRGLTRETSTGNFSVEPGASYGLRYTGHLPRPIQRAVSELVRDGGFRVKQVVYSYSTPIAILLTDGEHSAWIIPDVTYSATTSTRHANRLHGLTGYTQSVPWDATAADIARVVRGVMVYARPWTRGKLGKWITGPNWTPGA